MYRILIVEDDDKIGDLLKKSVEKYGFEAYRATRFRELTEELDMYSPHVVLLDIHLPYYDGFTGAASFGRVPRRRLFSFRPARERWIRSWRSKTGAMITSRSRSRSTC
ncbi:hypothetical protein PACILC2_34120 [Paenibacillus cisolokensis]|uniref:Response regulatory domain-containing protein n=1 Tax=Paenibacillus cisolokensis TaxID=1658519 RepID=A0ABQ4N9C8_9BACL|nr:hypothetical protein PACILC2_34120 [Paenibacillus cisolokensis]